MTVEAPDHLYALTPAAPQDSLVAAINRLAIAVEQHTLALLDMRAPQTLAPLPPVQSAPAAVNPVGPAVCPVHRVPWNMVPAGISKRTGKRYDAFLACPERGCDQRPA